MTLQKSLLPPLARSPGDQVHWLDEDWTPEHYGSYRIYEIRIGYMDNTYDDASIITFSTLALSFNSAYVWARDRVKEINERGKTTATILSVHQTGQTIDAEDMRHCLNGTGYAVAPSLVEES